MVQVERLLLAVTVVSSKTSAWFATASSMKLFSAVRESSLAVGTAAAAAMSRAQAK